MLLSVKGTDESGYWVNLGPGAMRLGCIFPTKEQAVSMLLYHGRNCGIHTIQIDTVEARPSRHSVREAFRAHLPLPQDRSPSTADADPSL